MAQNLATKYAKKVDERFHLVSFTDAAVNQDYDWVGVNAINIYNVDTVTMGDYTRTGADRYGVAAELGTGKQTLTLAKDRAATWTIDRRNLDESMMTQQAGASLARQVREVVVPEIDKYRLAAIHTAAANHTATAAITASNAYLKFLDAQAKLDDDLVPITGRLCYCTPAYYNFIKQDSTFIKASDLGQKIILNGQVGEVDGVKLVKVPTSYLPTNAAFLLLHPRATVGPKILESYKIHQDPPGISGWLVEMRIVYDAFVLTNKLNSLARHQIA